ncbi:response regulator transcription factor [Lederbergia lenta]|uniref:Two-component response regulator n=1 Tax=Lederbergia lenta TaxID=1467 RepID=A0A2X4VTE1_LEDLE|nr:response regulator transcription factor [Lederbergia lenta]MCM3110995.1 response regulator transcription factor [Lederbergia lenta]MEC2325616.1 response regulator transcription factor [Lederbergia lenta]SQI54153.1 two-component response regulator [Lederbergia lenta]
MSLRAWCKVLVVDDEVLIRQGIKHYINWEQEGFQIIGEASNGKEALTIIETEQPHIVITDMVMPVMDGEELTRVIKRKYPQIEIIVLSSFGDFDYVRSTFQHGVSDYILKPKLEGPELLRSLQHAASKLPSFHLLKNKSTSHSSIERVLDRVMSGFNVTEDDVIINEAFPNSHFCLFAVEAEVGDKKGERDLWLLRQYISDIIKDELTDIIYHSLIITENTITFLLNMDKDQLPAIKYFIKAIAQSKKCSERIVAIALSEPFVQFAEVKNMHEEKLLPLMQYRFYLPEKTVFIYDELPLESDKKESFKLTHFIEVFKREQFDDAFTYLEKHTNYLAQHYTMDVLAFKSFIGNIIFNVTTLLGNMKYDNHHLERAKYGYLAKIDGASSAREALLQLDECITVARHVISETRLNMVQPNMQKLLNYIDKHYAEVLSLTEMANHFHFNPSYLSNYFSMNNNEGFNEYLNKVRIEKSTQLLRENTTPISEISHLVGYSDHSYFCKVFKKMMGTSPSKYRKQFHQTKKEENEKTLHKIK